MTEFAPHHSEAKPAGWCSEETLLLVRTGADPGGDAPPTSHFQINLKAFFKGIFTPFLGPTSLNLVNIQPNTKFYPPSPPKFSSFF